MARLQHTVTVVAVDRERLDGCAGPVCDLVESTRARGRDVLLPDGRAVPGLALVKGRHLRPGARYETSGTDDGQVQTTVLREWRRGGALAVEQLFRSAEFSARTAVRLRRPERPASLEVEARVRGAEGSGRLHRLQGRASLDLAAWWAAAAAAPGASAGVRAPATVRLKHLLGIAHLRLGPRPAGPGLWQVDVTLSLRGRWLLRPVVAFALLLASVPLRRGFRTSVEEAARQWNDAIGSVLAHDPDAFRRELAEYLAKGPQATGPAPSTGAGTAPPPGTTA